MSLLLLLPLIYSIFYVPYKVNVIHFHRLWAKHRAMTATARKL